jgi:putative hydrolase of the HAD superfamily
VWRELAPRFGLPPGAAAGFRESVAHWPAFADAAVALLRLKRRFRLVAATDAQRWGHACFERSLRMPFDCSVTCDDSGHEKPDPRYFMTLRNTLAGRGIAQADTLHVGHGRFDDIRIAQALGWRTCLIERPQRDGHGAAWPMRAARPDWRFNTLRALADAVDAEAAVEAGETLPLFDAALA